MLRIGVSGPRHASQLSGVAPSTLRPSRSCRSAKYPARSAPTSTFTTNHWSFSAPYDHEPLELLSSVVHSHFLSLSSHTTSLTVKCHSSRPYFNGTFQCRSTSEASTLCQLRWNTRETTSQLTSTPTHAKAARSGDRQDGMGGSRPFLRVMKPPSIIINRPRASHSAMRRTHARDVDIPDPDRIYSGVALSPVLCFGLPPRVSVGSIALAIPYRAPSGVCLLVSLIRLVAPSCSRATRSSERLGSLRILWSTTNTRRAATKARVRGI